MISALPYHTSATTQKQHHNYDLTSYSTNNNNKNNHTTTTANTDYLQPQIYQSGQQSQLSPQFETSSSSDPASSPSSTDFEVTDNGLDNWLLANSMQSESWGPLAQQFTPKMSRFSHQRESSLSSLGSTGPASPFNHNTSNPQIAVSDSASDGLHDMQAHDAQGNYYQLAKSLGSFPGYQNFDPAMPEMAYPIMPGSNGKGRLDRTMLPAPDFHNVPNRSHPASVASSLASDSPATPTNGETENDRRRKGFNNNVPRLDRTMTDVYGDELFNPNFSITSTSPSQQTMAVSPSRNNDLFNQRINAANSQHLSSTHSPASSTSRDKSPFLNGSPHAPAVNGSNDMMGSQQGMHHFGAAQRMRQQGKDAQLLQQQMGNAAGEPETPKTISPKDAILEFNEADGDANFPLFPQDSTNFDMDQLTKSMIPPMSTADVSQSILATHNGGAMNQIPYLQSQLAAGLQIPQYNFMPRQQPSHDTPPRLSSAGSSSAGSGPNTPVNRSRPAAVGADGGTYTCTYHGCTLRFETPALLQKHKREGHRATQGFGNPRPSDVGGMTSSLLNSQAGPHRCDRINPSTGKPCSTVFSRPYDLTRHEDTIHNARKQKVRCNLCTEEKTFSRADALTRHYRVCHPDMELPGKHRRRGGV